MDFVFRGIYSLIYCYSALEIWGISNIKKWSENAIIRQIYNYVERIYDSFYPTLQQYLFVENGCQTIIHKCENQDINMLKLLEPERYDFILRNDYVKNERNYKIIYDRVENIKPNYELSNISFLFFIVQYKKIDVDIQLNTKKYTYMVVGNRINKKFIYYLLKNMGVTKDLYEDFDYSIQILTQKDVSFINLSSSEELIIMKNHLK